MPHSTFKIKNPVKRDGTSQKQRQLAALDPSSVKIDERTLEDFLVFTQEYAKRVWFYDLENKQDSTWEAFWGSDPTLVIAAIEKTNPLPAKMACDEITSKDPSVEGLNDLVDQIFVVARKIDYWFLNLLTGSSLNIEIKRLILANFQGFLKKLATYEKGATELFQNYPEIEEDDYNGFSREWGFTANDLGNIVVDPALFRPEAEINEENPAKCLDNLSPEEQLKAAYEGLKDLFTKAYNVYFQIIQVSPAHFQESLKRTDHPAHVALFITFLLLYRQVQDDLNQMTQRHLDFYYKDILGMKSKEAVPDKIHLFFELAKNHLEHSLDGGIRFKAGKDVEGNDLFFALDKNSVLNVATVESLRTLFLSTTSTGDIKKVTSVHAAPIANSADGMGAEIKDEEKPTWATLGNASMPLANIGFAVASKELLLAEGTRTVTLDVHTKDDVTLTGKPFDVMLSGEKEWITTDYSLDESSPASPPKPDKGFRVKFTLQADIPAVVPFDPKILKEDLGTELPLVKLLLRNSQQGKASGYEELRNLKIEKIDLTVEVTGVQQVMAFNDEGPLNTGKPFMPFTSNPKKGSSFYVGYAEAFHKSLDEVKLKLTWEQVPDDFERHYRGYNLPGYTSSTPGNLAPDDFKMQISIQKNGSSINLSGYEPKDIFGKTDNGKGAGATDLVNEIDIKESVNLQNTYPYIDLEDYGIVNKNGFLKLDLQQDFEHDQYQEVLTRQMLAMSKFPTLMVGAYYIYQKDNEEKWEKFTGKTVNTLSEVVIPKIPYTPVLKSISISYKSSASTGITADSGAISFLHLHPFSDTYRQFENVKGIPMLPQFGGLVKQPPLQSSAGIPLISNSLTVTAPPAGQVILLEEAALLIGLNGLKAGQSLSLLFQVAESTADADLPKSQVRWYYLAANEWVPFEDYQVVSDTTDGLLTSGIVEFAIPDGINQQNTILPSSLHWLKASVTEYPGSISEAVNVHAQAARITFQDNNNDLSHLASPLPAGTISKLENDDPAIKGINQLYDSFGGQPAEDDLDFYTRVSERLRHKGRAITQFDYERLVLEAFPDIYKVSCINHTDSNHDLSPGHVLISVVPDFSKLKAVDRRQPKVTLAQLEKIKRFLEERNACFVSGSAVTLHVLNPVYEKIDFDFEVRFTPEITAIDFHIRKLKEDIVRYLSPWAFDDAAEINFGGRVFKSSILNFVEKQPYVDFVLNFKMMHDGSTQDTNIIEAKTPRSILVPVPEENMDIRYIYSDDHCQNVNRISRKALGYQTLDETVLGG